jgi:hypothetical protein
VTAESCVGIQKYCGCVGLDWSMMRSDENDEVTLASLTDLQSDTSDYHLDTPRLGAGGTSMMGPVAAEFVDRPELSARESKPWARERHASLGRTLEHGDLLHYEADRNSARRDQAVMIFFTGVEPGAGRCRARLPECWSE